MNTCSKAIREAARALAEERHLDVVRYGVDVLLLCDRSAAERFLVENLAPAAARLAVRDIVPFMKRLMKAGVSIVPALFELWGTLDRLSYNCDAMVRIALSTLKAAKEAEWPGPRWILAAPVLSTIHSRCGGVPDSIVEELGDEWGPVEAFLEEEVAKVNIAGEELTVIAR